MSKIPNKEDAARLHEITKKTPVGGDFEWNGAKYRVLEHVGGPGAAKCTCCDLYYDKRACLSASCIRSQRNDGKKVVFVKAEGGER